MDEPSSGLPLRLIHEADGLCEINDIPNVGVFGQEFLEMADEVETLLPKTAVAKILSNKHDLHGHLGPVFDPVQILADKSPVPVVLGNVGTRNRQWLRDQLEMVGHAVARQLLMRGKFREQRLKQGPIDHIRGIPEPCQGNAPRGDEIEMVDGRQVRSRQRLFELRPIRAKLGLSAMAQKELERVRLRARQWRLLRGLCRVVLCRVQRNLQRQIEDN